MTVLRFIHITCGSIWVGSVVYLALFIMPTVKALGPGGAPFMQQLPQTNKMPTVMATFATLTILAGLWLYYIVSGGFSMSYIGTTHGLIVTLGGCSALTAYIIAMFINRPTVEKIGHISHQIAQSGAPPTPEQMQQLGVLRAKIFRFTNILAIVLVLTVSIMAIMRYL